MPILDEVAHLKQVAKKRGIALKLPYRRSFSRRTLYRHARRLISSIISKNWNCRSTSLHQSIRFFLQKQNNAYLLRVLRNNAFALALAGSLVMGTNASAAPPFELINIKSDLGGFLIEGGHTNDHRDGQSGFSAANAGDVNGDGYDDIITGAFNSHPNGYETGETYVIFGGPAMGTIDLEDIHNGVGNGFSIRGANINDNSGKSVSGAGDVNDDGLDDLIIGAPLAGPGSSIDFGAAYVVFGKTGTAAIELSQIALGNGGFVINGLATQDSLGTTVSGAGDVNGDDMDDVIVSSPKAASDGVYRAGEAYVIFGKKNNTTAVSITDILAGTGGFVIKNDTTTSNYSQTAMAQSVSGAGDVNNDGLDDVIVGHNQVNGYRGAAYVIFGKSADTDPVKVTDILSGTGGFAIAGVDTFDRTGKSVSGAGDVNGDGYDDLIVGAYVASPNDVSTAGASFVVFGGDISTTVDLSDVAGGQGGFKINGIDSGDWSGWAVSEAGDTNGDGYDDLIIGAPRARPAGLSTAERGGEAYLVFGKTSGTTVELSDINNGSGGFIIRGYTFWDQAGKSVGGGGDINGDGLADIIVGAHTADVYNQDLGITFTSVGHTSVIFGRPTVEIVVGVQDASTGVAITDSGVFIERADAPVGFQASFSDIDGSNDAIFRSRLSDGVTYNVRANAAGYLPSSELTIFPDLTGNPVATIDLTSDTSLTNSNTINVTIELPDAQEDIRLVTKSIILRDPTTQDDLGLTSIFGDREMIFLGVPSGAVEVFVADTTDFSFTAETVTLGTGVTEDVVLTASIITSGALQGGTGTRSELPGNIVGVVKNTGNGNSVNLVGAQILSEQTGGIFAVTLSKSSGVFFLPAVVPGTGTIQSFSSDGNIAGTILPVNVPVGGNFGNLSEEDTDFEVNLAPEPSNNESSDFDSDFDGMEDAWEIQEFGNKNKNGTGDADADGLTDLEEYIAGTDPNAKDSDNDGLNDAAEIQLGSDPNNINDRAPAPEPVWVDFNYNSNLHVGTVVHPYKIFSDALSAVANNGTIRIKGDSDVTTGNAPNTINSNVDIEAHNGKVKLQ